jgi:beta-glucosidase
MTKLTLSQGSPMREHNFVFGVATSSFQIEGATHSRARNIWDTFCEKPGAIKDGSNGEPGCEHVQLWQRDIELIQSLNVDAYRLSISWPRVINDDASVNKDGLAFYVNLLSALKRQGIKTYVTLYHWDLPQHLEDQGGWLNRTTVDAFTHYAEVVINALSGLVDSYATFNEPWCSAYLGHEVGVHAPGKTGRKNGITAAHHLLLAHGQAMKVLEQLSPNTENGIVVNLTPCFAATKSEKDHDAAEIAHDYFNRWYLDPILNGRYPSLFDKFIRDHNLFDLVKPGDLEIINHAVDFVGVNYYTKSTFCADSEHGFRAREPVEKDLTDMGWEIYPKGLTEILTWLNDTYAMPPIYITENGAAMPDEVVDGEVNDIRRTAYFQSHLNAVEEAMGAGVNIKGYFAWSLMDNFEWAEGYEKRFGIVWVDFKSQTRIIKASGKAYQHMLASR